jgi:hypothetical protein
MTFLQVDRVARTGRFLSSCTLDAAIARGVPATVKKSQREELES